MTTPVYAKGVVRPLALLRIITTPIVRACSGIGALTLPVDAVETDPANRYLGCGWLNDLPELESIQADEASRVVFSLSGVDQRTVVLVEAEDVAGAQVDFGIAWMTRARTFAGPVLWDFTGRAETTGIDDVSASGDATATSGRQLTVSLTVVIGDAARRTPSMGLWTPQDWRRDHPTDAYCDLVPSYDASATRTHPPR